MTCAHLTGPNSGVTVTPQRSRSHETEYGVPKVDWPRYGTEATVAKRTFRFWNDAASMRGFVVGKAATKKSISPCLALYGDAPITTDTEWFS